MLRALRFAAIGLAVVAVAAGCGTPPPGAPAPKTRLHLVGPGQPTAPGQTFEVQLRVEVNTSETVNAIAGRLTYDQASFAVSNAITVNTATFGTTVTAVAADGKVLLDTGTFDPIGNGDYLVATLTVTTLGEGTVPIRFTSDSTVLGAVSGSNQLGPTVGYPAGGTIMIPVDSIAAAVGTVPPGSPPADTPLAALSTAKLAAGSFLNADVAKAAETRPDGTYAGQCRIFVRDVLLQFGIYISGASPDGYFTTLAQQGGIRITDQNRLGRGDVVQYGYSDRLPGIHTFIVQRHVTGNQYDVIDSNFRGNERVLRHRVNVVLDDTHRAYRFGYVPGYWRGDINGDHQVDLLDFSIMAGNFGRTVPVGMMGDVNFDTRVTIQDFSILAGNYMRIG